MWIKEETLKKVDELKELISTFEDQRVDFWDEDESIGTYDKFGHVTYDFDDQIIYHPIGCSTLGYTNCRLLSDIEKGI